MNCCKPAWTTAAVLGALLALGPASAGAKELSDVKVDFVGSAAANGEDADDAGALRLRLQERRAELQLRFKRLTPEAWYALVIGDEDQLCFQPGANGSVNLRMVQTADIPDPNFFDPRGADLFLERDMAEDCGDPNARTEVLCASLDPGNGRGNDCKGKRLKVQEQTELEPTPAAEGGSAELRFRLLPNGKRRFNVRLKHVPPTEDYYYLYVGEESSAREEMISVNSGGVGRLDFTEKPPKNNGGGKGRKQKVEFDKDGQEFDPYDEDVEICSVELGDGAEECSHGAGTRVFYGRLFAQIPGLNVCDEIDEAVADLADPNGAEMPWGTARFGVDEDCDRRLEVEVRDLDDGFYTVLLSDGTETETPIGTIEVSGGEGELRVDAELLPDPDPVGEEVLVNDPNGVTTVLRGTLM